MFRVLTLVLILIMGAFALNTARHYFAAAPLPLKAMAGEPKSAPDQTSSTAGSDPAVLDQTAILTSNLTQNPPPDARVIEDRFIVRGNIEQTELARLTKRLSNELIQPGDPEIIQLPTAGQNFLNSTGSGTTPPAQFDDIYCPYNTELSEQCGGGEEGEIGNVTCTFNPTVSFYDNCNYGEQNKPQIDPRHPTPGCTTDATPACLCELINTPPCGVVKRLKPPGCLDCCAPLPVSCEQCCAGRPWLYDTQTQGCACGGPPESSSGSGAP